MKRYVLPPATLERMLDRFRTIDERERIKPMNVEIHRTRALLLVFAAAVVATVLSTLMATNPA
jgi:hypothetical protein